MLRHASTAIEIPSPIRSEAAVGDPGRGPAGPPICDAASLMLGKHQRKQARWCRCAGATSSTMS